MKTSRPIGTSAGLLILIVVWFAPGGLAQVNSGSDGRDGPLDPGICPGGACSVVIDMHDHPDGVYQYTAVNMAPGVTVTFVPNSNNTPVVWLVQSNCVISGGATVIVTAQGGSGGSGGAGGPGGFRGGNGGTLSAGGMGPGGGLAGGYVGGTGSYGMFGTNAAGTTNGDGAIYGNQFLLPLVGGSGGAGSMGSCSTIAFGGGGGGGALLIVASGRILLDGSIEACGGPACGGFYACPGGFSTNIAGGDGSGGAVRLVASQILGSGSIYTGRSGSYCGEASFGGLGRVRLDSPDLNFGGIITAVASQGFQPIIIPSQGTGVQLAIASIGGVPVSASPTGQLATPDAVLSSQQSNPIPIVVNCSNIPLNTQITVVVRPATGPAVSATGLNNTGTLLASTATVLLNMPRGGGIIYATAAN